ncbi:MAG: hypothetical protein NVS4B11_34280 [Ktedonobacteraceae bacterium]
MGQTSENRQPLYISPEDDITTICERLEQAASKHIILIIPPQNQLRAYRTWHTLYVYARRHGKIVQILSSSSYIRSIARGAHFTAAKTLDELVQEKPTHLRRSTQSASPIERTDVVDSVDFSFPTDDESIARPARSFPYAEPDDDPFVFMLEEEDELPPLHPRDLPKPPPPPIRLAKPPVPLNMPTRRTHSSYAPPPRLPWDDEDDILPLIPPRRSTDPLARTRLRGRDTKQAIRRRSEPLRFIAITPIVFVSLFVLVRSIVQYLRARRMR